jgi:hypothetical protein
MKLSLIVAFLAAVALTACAMDATETDPPAADGIGTPSLHAAPGANGVGTTPTVAPTSGDTAASAVEGVGTSPSDVAPRAAKTAPLPSALPSGF